MGKKELDAYYREQDRDRRIQQNQVKEHYFDSLVAQAEQDEMIPASFIPQVKTWKFGPAQGDSEVKSHPLSVGGMEIVLNLQGCVSPFDSSSLNGGARKTLTLRLSKIWDEPFGEMEEALIKEAATKSQTLFGEKLTEEQLQERYKPIGKKAGEYPRQIRTKLNTDGFYACRYWDSERKRAEPPEDHTGLVFNAVIKLRGLWVSSEAWGLVCDATDLQLLETAQVECPF